MIDRPRDVGLDADTLTISLAVADGNDKDPAVRVPLTNGRLNRPVVGDTPEVAGVPQPPILVAAELQVLVSR